MTSGMNSTVETTSAAASQARRAPLEEASPPRQRTKTMPMAVTAIGGSTIELGRVRAAARR